MNPRRRRLLIPGLLVALMVVVAVAALMDRAEAAPEGPLTTLTDVRITESSGLAVSLVHDDLAYTVNDSGGAAEIFAIDLDSGAVVGVTTVRTDFVDVEALALRDGTLWIADVGDNLARRDDGALHAIDEPGRGTRTVDSRRYPVALQGGPADVEALLAEPDSDRLYVVTKSLASAAVLSLSESDLDDAVTTMFTPVAEDLPALVTDGAFSPDGSDVALLSYGSVWVVDPTDWTVVGRQSLPALDQAETLAFVDRDAVLVGSEGAGSPLYRIDLRPDEAHVATVATVATPAAERPTSSPPAETEVLAEADAVDGPRVVLLGGAGAAGLVALGGLVAWRLRARSTGSRRAIR